MKPQHFIIGLLLISGWFVYEVYRPFWQDISIAILLAFATLSIAHQVEKRLAKQWQVSAAMTLLLGLMFFAPLVYMINAVAILVTHIDPLDVQETVEQIASYLQTISLPDDLMQRLNIDPSAMHDYLSGIFSEENIHKYFKNALTFLGSMATHSAVFFKDMMLILIFYFFTYLYGEQVGRFIKKVLPLEMEQTHLLFSELSNSMGVVFFSILATAILEGTLFAAIAFYFGLDAILLGILYGFASLVPVVGGALMWVPTAIYLWFTKGHMDALVLAVYSIVVISVVADTFIKPVIIREIDHKLLKETQAVNEILVFFSIIAGLSTFGFWGMIIGPAITTIFLAILNLYADIQNTFKETT